MNLLKVPFCGNHSSLIKRFIRPFIKFWPYSLLSNVCDCCCDSSLYWFPSFDNFLRADVLRRYWVIFEIFSLWPQKATSHTICPAGRRVIGVLAISDLNQLWIKIKPFYQQSTFFRCNCQWQEIGLKPIFLWFNMGSTICFLSIQS